MVSPTSWDNMSSGRRTWADVNVLQVLDDPSGPGEPRCWTVLVVTGNRDESASELPQAEE